MFDDLLGRSVDLTPTDPLRAADVPRSLVALYTDSSQKLRAVVGMSFELTAFAGAAIGLIPPGGAQACIEDKEISKMIGENVIEVCNVIGSLLNQEGADRLTMHQTFLPGQTPPNDAVGYLLALGRREDFNVAVTGYGTGKLSLALT